jgi:hypothetical protein
MIDKDFVPAVCLAALFVESVDFLSMAEQHDSQVWTKLESAGPCAARYLGNLIKPAGEGLMKLRNCTGPRHDHVFRLILDTRVRVVGVDFNESMKLALERPVCRTVVG